MSVRPLHRYYQQTATPITPLQQSARHSGAEPLVRRDLLRSPVVRGICSAQSVRGKQLSPFNFGDLWQFWQFPPLRFKGFGLWAMSLTPAAPESPPSATNRQRPSHRYNQPPAIPRPNRCCAAIFNPSFREAEESAPPKAFGGNNSRLSLSAIFGNSGISGNSHLCVSRFWGLRNVAYTSGARQSTIRALISAIWSWIAPNCFPFPFLGVSLSCSTSHSS